MAVHWDNKREAHIPKGPRTQIIVFQGPNTVNCKSIWSRKPYFLGPWTLRVLDLFRDFRVLT